MVWRYIDTAAMKEPIYRQKLTKRFFMSLSEGLYLSSNTYIQRGCPSFSERVSPPSEREQQWERILIAGVNGRLCNVFASEADFYEIVRDSNRVPRN
jgi:hypothetical protein